MVGYSGVSAVERSSDGTCAWTEVQAPLHCGVVMELVTPAAGSLDAVYTFDRTDVVPVILPPVWRCGCGFQVDAWAPEFTARIVNSSPVPGLNP
jgi:hypothetical protein